MFCDTKIVFFCKHCRQDIDFPCDDEAEITTALHVLQDKRVLNEPAGLVCCVPWAPAAARRTGGRVVMYHPPLQLANHDILRDDSFFMGWGWWVATDPHLIRLRTLVCVRAER